MGFDDSITRDNIVEELKKIMNCTEENFKLGALINYENKWKISLSCKDRLARRLFERRKFRIGWTHVTVVYRKKAIKRFHCLRDILLKLVQIAWTVKDRALGVIARIKTLMNVKIIIV